MFLRSFFSVFLLLTLSTFGQEAPVSGEGNQETALKVATVDIQKLFQGYRKTLAAEREIDLARADIQKKGQLATNEIQVRRRMTEKRIFEVRNGNASEKEITELQRELPILFRELKMAGQEKRVESESANSQLNQQMVRRMTGILEEIVALTAKKAEADGYDLVIDISGTNSNQVAPMLFAKNATDITPLMQKELGNKGDDNR